MQKSYFDFHKMGKLFSIKSTLISRGDERQSDVESVQISIFQLRYDAIGTN